MLNNYSEKNVPVPFLFGWIGKTELDDIRVLVLLVVVIQLEILNTLYFCILLFIFGLFPPPLMHDGMKWYFISKEYF